MKSSVKNGAASASPSQRILTQGRLAAALLGFCVFAADSTAEVVERYDASGTLTASGTDVAAVQKEAGAAESDVIVISGTAAHNTGINQTLKSFTIRSAESGVKQTINAGNTRLYNFNDGDNTYNIKFQDLDYQGYANAVSNAIGLFIHTSPALTLNINADNVSFTGFKAQTHHGGVFGIDGGGNLNITAVNGIVFDSNRTNASTGGAIHVNTGKLNISGDSLTFSNNFAKTYGGAIYSKASVAITGNSILFENNSVSSNDGGAVCASGALSISGTSADSVITFNNNHSPYKAGAVFANALTLRTGTFNFTGNYNSTESSKYTYGGAINCSSIDADAKVINFDSNSSKYYGGALHSSNGGTIKAETIIFNKNSSLHFGGAIHSGGTLTITGKNVSFTQNYVNSNDSGAIHSDTLILRGLDSESVFTFSENYAQYYGGAIYSGALTLETGTFNFIGNYNRTSSDAYTYGGAVNCSSLTVDATVLNFDSNTSKYYGGGLSIKSGSAVIQADTLTFNKNTASNFGGAVYAEGNLTFAGDDTVGTFTDNTAGNGNGNDLYLAGTSSVLTFQDAGVYSFDGGIILAGESAQTVIDQAQVVIAGRANNAASNYQLRNVTISNGGMLTADLTDIDSFSGVFNVGTADSAGTLELNVREGASKSLALSDSSKISGTNNGKVTKTGEGTLQLNAPQDSLTVEELTVSAGRLDLQGSMTGGLTVGTNAVFSPGNSVGEAVVDGEFKLDQEAVLLLEQDANGMDLLKADSFDVDSGFIELEMGLVLPEMQYPIIQNTAAEFGAEQGVDFWTSLLTPTSAYSWDLSVIGNTVYATIDANAVPEPSAWMLLLLGSFGLLYWRKKK